MITLDKAARRYLQINALEAAVRTTEAAVDQVQKEIDDAQERLADLRRQKRQLLEDIRLAARDEGQLPLFDNFSHALSVCETAATAG